MRNRIENHFVQHAICNRNFLEMARYENTVISVTRDAGHSWEILPWKPSLYIKFFVALGNFSWPPLIDCIGWREGKIAIAWHSMFDSELEIGKFVGTFDETKKKWSMTFIGRFDLSDAVLTTWFDDAGFEVLARPDAIIAN